MSEHPPLPALREGWSAEAARLWAQGQQEATFAHLITELNRHGRAKPTALVMQLVYYMFQRGDWLGAAGALVAQHQNDPDNPEVLINLAACLSRSGRHGPAVEAARAYLARFPADPALHDVLCKSLHALGQTEQALAAGTESLRLKDARAVARHAQAALQGAAPAQAPAGTGGPAPAAAARVDVIAFSLWGAKRRYLWGALDNLLQAARLYPGWQVRIYLDESVPAAWRQAMADLGAELRLHPADDSLRQRLCRRFLAANDPSVHRFMVRDADSVIGPREQRAVQAWLDSGQPFHAMRDWWTHTDLLLAGMWGGTSGLLPPLAERLAAYQTGLLETPNIDQWFLRDEVWPLIRDRCLVHDRLFTPPGARPWPEPAPPGIEHVGLNVHALDPDRQAARLRPWIDRLPPLAEP